MRAFYRFLAPLPETDLPSGVVLDQDEAFVWILAETDPAPELVALGGQRLGATLTELAPADRDHCAWQRVERAGERLNVPPSTVLPTDTLLGGPLPRTVFAGDDPAELL